MHPRFLKAGQSEMARPDTKPIRPIGAAVGIEAEGKNEGEEAVEEEDTEEGRTMRVRGRPRTERRREKAARSNAYAIQRVV